MDNIWYQGRIQDFKLGGGALKKIAPSGGRRENFWDISCEKSRFYAKKSYFFKLRREARTFLGYFVWKITILRPKIIFFSNFRGGAPPWIRPWVLCLGAWWMWSYGSWIYQRNTRLTNFIPKPVETTLCDKDCQWLAADGLWFSSGNPVYSIIQLTAMI